MEKWTLITGACGGLGRAFVNECASNGENLVLTGTSNEKLEALKTQLLQNFKDIQVEILVLNLADKSSRENVLKFLDEKQIKVTRLINNAGVIIEGDLERFDDDEIAEAIEVNCVGTLDLTKKLLRVRDSGQKFEVLTVSSQASFQPIPHIAVYAATKSFLLSMMTALSVEFENKNVVITTTCPSGMATTDAMKESIKSMGINGKLTTLPVSKVAKISLNALKKEKKVVIPGRFNKFVEGVSRPFSQVFLAKRTGSIWKKSQRKRNF
jgi:short-subunit dehydrogenase